MAPEFHQGSYQWLFFKIVHFYWPIVILWIFMGHFYRKIQATPYSIYSIDTNTRTLFAAFSIENLQNSIFRNGIEFNQK